MRANEFVTEGPKLDKAVDTMQKPADKLGNWMQGQVAGRQAKDKAAAQRQNSPKIAKLLQQQLAAKASQAQGKPNAIAKMANSALSKTLQISASAEPEIKDSVKSIVSALASDPANFARSQDVLSQLTDLVANSFKQERSATDAMSPELVAQLKAKVKGMKPQEARKTVVAELVKIGYSKEEAAVAADDFFTGNTGSGEETDLEIIQKAIKDKIIGDPAFDTVDRVEDKNNGTNQIETTLRDNGIKTTDPDYNDARDGLLNDPEMPWNKPYMAKVIAPQGWKHTSVVYVWYNDRLSEWKIADNDQWELIRYVKKKGEFQAIKTMFDEKSASAKMRQFKNLDGDFYTVTRPKK